MAYVSAVLKMIKLCKSRDFTEMFPCNQSCLSSRTQPDPAFGQPSSSPKKKPSEPHRFTPAKGLSSKFHFWGPKLLFQSQFSLCGSVLLPQGHPGLMSRRGSALRWDRALFLLLIIARIGDFLLLLFFWIFSCITCLKQQASQRCALHVATQPLTKQTKTGSGPAPPNLAPRLRSRRPHQAPSYKAGANN